MWDHWHRVVLGAVAGLAVLSGAASILLSVARTTAQGDTHVIEIIETGFNPQNCVRPREEPFQFLNKTDEPQRVLSEQNPYLDTGEIPPGELSKTFTAEFAGSLKFYLESNPEFVGQTTVLIPARTSCDPLPPTPTPTNTPTQTPTPIPTPEGRKGLIPQISREQDVVAE